MAFVNDVAIFLVEMLNRALKKDHAAIQALFKHRVCCNKELADDVTIQVRRETSTPLTYSVSILGLLNGIGIQDSGMGYIASIWSVVCQKCNTKRDGTICDNCEVCGTKLSLGELEEFRYIGEE